MTALKLRPEGSFLGGALGLLAPPTEVSAELLWTEDAALRGDGMVKFRRLFVRTKSCNEILLSVVPVRALLLAAATITLVIAAALEFIFVHCQVW